VAEKLSALRAESYFAERAARTDIPRALDILKRAGVGNSPAKDTHNNNCYDSANRRGLIV